MNRLLPTAAMLLLAITAPAQQQKAHSKFQILVTNEEDKNIIAHNNDRLQILQQESRGMAERGLLGNLTFTGYASSITQKTINASQNLVSLGLSYAVEALSSKREKWLSAARRQCTYRQLLTSQTTINDFYALPSTKGAMDPANLQFQGFGCKNYIEVDRHPDRGRDVFYIYCRLRQDDEGRAHIVNHSKFLVEVDTVAIDPRYLNLPNDSSGRARNNFSFEKRKDLRLQLKARIYSSWLNQATMITTDQQLGQFTVDIKVDPNMLTPDSMFIYDKSNPAHRKLVSVSGDSFIVPRSYTGTVDGDTYQPAWGTGQYRIEMEVVETCNINEDYYLIRPAGNAQEVAFAGATPGKKKWDKAKWKTEWSAMNARKRSNSLLQNAWECITKAYKGSGWVATLTDPFATALYDYETKKLTSAFDDLHKSWFDGEPMTPAAAGAKAGAAGAAKGNTGAAAGANGTTQKPKK